jgi:EpsI family protein
MSFRFWSAILLLSATVVVLHARPNTDRNPPTEPLSLFPNNIGGWVGADQSIDQETLDVLGSGDFLSRIYTGDESAPPVNLFLGYFPTQRTGQTIHSPKHCLPGSGWTFESSTYLTLNDLKGRPHRVGEYVIANGDERQFVIYWYEAHGRSVASEYAAKLYLVADAIRMNRTDGALLRVVTPVSPRDGIAGARARAEVFTARIAPLLPQFIPD